MCYAFFPAINPTSRATTPNPIAMYALLLS
ncbi:hypothetical protein KAOT1_00985, partial [Kordia algicida OT-1]